MLSRDTQSLRWFQDSRKSLIEAATILAEFGAEKQNNQLKQRADVLSAKLESFHFNLVLLGEFKRGKSTLVNALIGKSVLPTATIPLTSVTTVVRYGAEPRLRVTLGTGQLLDLPISEIESYVTERGNPENRRNVQVVEVDFPAGILQEGVRIVDTPGTGSVHLHNTETTYKFLPEADAGIFVFSADQPASRGELDLLREARKFAKRLFLVQNKIDYLDETNLSESLSFLQQTLERELCEPCFVYPLSAKRALEAKLSDNEDLEKLGASGFRLFETDLLKFLVNEKAKTFISSTSARVRSLALETENLIKLERQMVQVPAADLENCLFRFREAGEEIISQQSDAEHIVRGEIAALISAVEEDLKPVVAANKSLLVKTVNETYEKYKGLGKEELIDTLRSALKERIETIFNEWRENEDRKINVTFEKLTKRFVDRENQVINEVKKVTRDLLKMEVTVNFEIEALTSKSRHYYAVDNPFTLAIQTLPLILPDPISKWIIRSRFLEAAESELLRNAGRLRADYQERIDVSTRQFLIKFRGQIAAALGQIEQVIKQAIERQKSVLADQATAEKRLTEELSTIKQVKSLAACSDF